jgi:polysaccharide biosynthesis protein PslG
MKTLVIVVIILVSSMVHALKITDFEKGKGGVLWLGKKSGGEFTYAAAPEPRGKSAKITWKKRKLHPYLSVSFWNPQIKETKAELDGELSMWFYPGKGKEQISSINARMMDADGEVFQWKKRVNLKSKGGWQKLTWDVNPDNFIDCYGGGKKANKKINLPVRFYSVVVRFKSPMSDPGYIYFDDVEYKNSKYSVKLVAKYKAEIKLTNPEKQSVLVYHPNGKIIFKVIVTDQDKVFGQSLKVLVSDIHDKVVFKNVISVGKTGLDIEIPVSLNTLGFFRLKVLLIEKNKTKAYATTTFSVIPKPLAVPNDVNMFGVNFHLNRIPLSQAEIEVRMAKRIGIAWGRGMIPKWKIQPRNGSYAAAFKQYDKLLTLAEESGISILGVLHYIPRWASAAPANASYMVYSRIMPADLGVVSNFCEQYARRCRGFVEYWEVGNEVDAHQFWKGSWESYRTGDKESIIRDYVSFLGAASKGFRKGNPSAKILFSGLTSHGTAAYMPKAMKAGAAKHFDILNTHYLGDVKALQAIDNSRPIWITEIGRASYPAAHTLKAERTQIVNDITQCVIQLVAGAQKVFKYDFRDDGTNPKEKQHNFGLIYSDFSPKPNYPAYATMIRLLAGGTYSRELNILRNASQGWLRGYAFSAEKDGEIINVIWLNSAKDATVSFSTPDSVVKVVDSMGNERIVTAKKGKVSFKVDELPFFVVGTLRDAKGKPTYPMKRKMRSVVIPVNNPGFEEVALDADIPISWSCAPGMVFRADSSQFYRGRRSGSVAIKKDSKGYLALKDYLPLFQKIDIASIIPELRKGEYITFSVEGHVKMKDVAGRGVTLTLSFNTKSERLGWVETPYKLGTTEWQLWKTKEMKLFKGTDTLAIQLHFAPNTTGKIWVDDIKLQMHIWERAK